MNSNTAQLTEYGTENVRLFARFALGVSFLSAVADRFGLLGPHGAKNVSWGDFAHFAEYTGKLMSLFPSSWTVSFAMGMATSLGIKAPLDYSVFSAAAAAFLLTFWEPDRFTLDKLLNRSGKRA